MQTKAFGFAFPSHRSHFTRELRRLPATRASTVNSPCEIRRQLHKYADTNTSAQTYIYIDLSKYVIIIFAELREIACHWPQRSIFRPSEDSWLSSSLSKSQWPIVTRSDQKTNCDGSCHVKLPGQVTAIVPNHALWWKLPQLETTLKVKSWHLRCPPDNMLGEGAVNVEGGGGGGGWRKRFNYTRESDLLVSADMVIAQIQKYK